MYVLCYGNEAETTITTTTHHVKSWCLRSVDNDADENGD